MENLVATPAPATATAVDAVAQTAAPRMAKADVPAAKGTEIHTDKTPKASEPEYFDVPVNGKTKRVTKDELLKHYSLEKAAEQRFNEAARMKREAEEREAVWNDPEKALALLKKRHPDKFRDTVESVYKREYIDPEDMSPAERRIAELEAENNEFKTKAQREAEEANARKEADEDAKTVGTLQKEIMSVIEQSGLPKTKFTASRVAYWMRQNEANNLGLPAELIIQKVKNERREIMKGEVSSMSVEQMIDTYGDDFIKKLRAWDIEQIRSRRNLPKIEKTSEAEPESRAMQFEKIRPNEVKRRMRTLFS